MRVLSTDIIQKIYLFNTNFTNDFMILNGDKNFFLKTHMV